MSLTTDPNDPRIGRGVDTEPRPQHEAYIVFSDEERAKGFVRPVRRSYKHVGKKSKYPLRPLTNEELERYAEFGYAAFEAYPESESPVNGRYWTDAELTAAVCGTVTRMDQAIAETYARDPTFYGSTYCCGCQMHLPVEEFEWVDDGTVVGS